MTEKYYFKIKNKMQEKINSYNLSESFYQTLLGEMIRIFGYYIVVPNFNYDVNPFDEEDEISFEQWNYEEQLDYTFSFLGGTQGWLDVLKATCAREGINNLLEDYNKLTWEQSDIFDDIILTTLAKKICEGIKYDLLQ